MFIIRVKLSYSLHHGVHGISSRTCSEGFKQDRERVYLLIVVMEALWPGELVVFILVHNQQYLAEMNSGPSIMITIFHTRKNTPYEKSNIAAWTNQNLWGKEMIVNSLPQEITMIINIIQDIGCNLKQHTCEKVW